MVVCGPEEPARFPLGAQKHDGGAAGCDDGVVRGVDACTGIDAVAMDRRERTRSSGYVVPTNIWLAPGWIG